MKTLPRLILPAILALHTVSRAAVPEVTAPPEDVRTRLALAPFYQKYVSVGGFPVVGSAKVPDAAMLEAAWLIGQMLDGRDDIRQAMVASKVRFSVMAIGELTTDIPEHSDLTPKQYWDKRARGLGATPARPSVSCGEENLLGAPGDPYRTENILIHEFAHAIHEMGLNTIDPQFDRKLKQAYRAAMDAGRWKGKYAATNRMEYWAEGVQSWFDTNRTNDHDHNHVHTREQLKEYDPALAELIASVFGDKPWRYTAPGTRRDLAHLREVDPAKLPAFAWPKELIEWNRANDLRAAKEKQQAAAPSGEK
jgi:hypothetical protein